MTSLARDWVCQMKLLIAREIKKLAASFCEKSYICCCNILERPINIILPVTETIDIP